MVLNNFQKLVLVCTVLFIYCRDSNTINRLEYDILYYCSSTQNSINFLIAASIRNGDLYCIISIKDFSNARKMSRLYKSQKVVQSEIEMKAWALTLWNQTTQCVLLYLFIDIK